MNLGASVEELKGVGPKRAEILKKVGIKTLRDFFYNLPRDYESFANPTTIAAMKPGKVVLKARLTALKTWQARRRKLTITEGILRDETGSVKAIWFNQAYRVKQFEIDKEYYFSGEFGLKNGRFVLSSPTVVDVDEVELGSALAPIYVQHGRIKSADFRRIMAAARDKFGEIPDMLPSVRPGVRRDALFKAHFPVAMSEVEKARDYLAYEELFSLILAARLNRRENDKLKAEPVAFDAPKVKAFVEGLPFKLTNAQRLAAWEIFKNMEKGTPMNRLLQGDVGSGKTMVAALSAYEVCMAGHQVALLAPTAILATQHFENLSERLGKFGVKVALLTGATKQKPELKRAIRAGEIGLVIGTHALLTDDTEFHDLALVIIDEQHRFGVEQRQKLVLKSPSGLAPHLLAMTATPIPRSLQLTVFGDLDVSILNELPKGRQPIETTILEEVEVKEQLYPKMREVLKQKQQIYWICRAIDDSTQPSGTSAKPQSEATSVKTRAEKLKKDFPGVRIEFLHGKMKPADKDAVMEAFSKGEIQILVSTTVVEVGVDVPNSTLMVIENAENYGLAQIHQLRGRVGRGSFKSYCYLLTSGDMQPSRRLRELEKSTDGFHLAEVDLKLRGPGEIYGSLQHGALDLRIASLTDTRIIHRAQTDVEAFLQSGENMLKYEELMSGISKYQQLTTLN